MRVITINEHAHGDDHEPIIIPADAPAAAVVAPPFNPKMALLALEQLLVAYACGEKHGSVDWEYLNIAFGYAREAMPGHYEFIKTQLEQDDDSDDDEA